MISFLIAVVIVYLGVTEGVSWFWWLIGALALVTSFTRENRLWPAIRRWARSSGQVSLTDDPTSLTGPQFEQWTAEHLEREGYEAEVTGGPGDGGCDVLAERAGRKVAVQCKRVSSSLGTEAIQDAVTAREANGADEGWVVTTAPEATE